MDNKSIFARNLKKQMDMAGKSRRDLCEALGVSYYTITDWVNAKKYPRMDKVELLAQYFGIMKSDLIEEKEKPSDTEGLSENHIKLIEFAKSVPEDKAEMILRVMRSIVEDGQ